MMLTGKEIERQVRMGNILIDPFDVKRVNPNSYNLRLSNQLAVYDVALGGYAAKGEVLEKGYKLYEDFEKAFDVNPDINRFLDMAKENKIWLIEIPPTGVILYPDMLFLGTTIERAGSDWFVPCVEGRSSIGRLGIEIHATAGFGDLGFKSHWTLEISVKHPVRVYAGVEVAQVIFTVPYQEDAGSFRTFALGHESWDHAGRQAPNPFKLYQGKYNGQTGPKPSGLWKEFQEGKYPHVQRESTPPETSAGDH